MQKLPERLEFSLSFHASRLAMALRREQMIALKPFQLTPEQWQVLAVLWEFDTVSQSDLAAITQRDEPSISRMVRTMETNGWVERNIDKTDGRTRRIRPSNKAWESRAELFNA
ncbi:MAG: MarR family transcriptional regulator, partial [Alphaproteobacteria bacterium]|nr:MarR family transcriptional regulator [Alphaproteobacteria bacterium]